MDGKELIKYLRTEFGLTLKEIAQASGLSVGGVKKIAYGQRKGSEKSIQALKGLEKDLKELRKLPSIQKRKKSKKGKTSKTKTKNKENYVKLWKSVIMKKIYEKNYDVDEGNYSSACYVINESVIDFYSKIAKKITKENAEKYIVVAKVKDYDGAVMNVTLNRYFKKDEFLKNVKSFVSEAKYNLCEAIKGMIGSEKKIKSVKYVFLGYIGKERKNERKK